MRVEITVDGTRITLVDRAAAIAALVAVNQTEINRLEVGRVQVNVAGRKAHLELTRSYKPVVFE